MAINRLPKITSDGGGGSTVKTPKASKVTVASKKTTKTEVKKPKTIAVTDDITSKSIAVVEPETIKVSGQKTVVKETTTNPPSQPKNPKIIKVSPKDPSSITMKLNIPKLDRDDRILRLENINDEPVIITNVTPTKTTPTIKSSLDDLMPTVTKDMGIPNDKIFSFIDMEGNAVGTLKDTKPDVKITTQEQLPVIEKVLSPVDENINKDPVTEMIIDRKYFMPTDIIDRKSTATVFNFDYLSYLFFQVDINQQLDSFYNAVDYIIENRLFARDEDYAEVAPENTLDDETMALVFNQIWTMAKNAVDENPDLVSIKNLIGFYIYFNRKLGFLPILVQGTTLNEFFSDMSLDSILVKLTTLGLYPISGYNLFERLWNSYTYSVTENANRAEIKLSLREFISYDINRNMAETYDGFPNKNDQLIIRYDLDPSKWTSKKTFRSDSAAFKRFKEIATAYITAQGATTLKRYLLDLLPVQDYAGEDISLSSSIFARKSIMYVSTTNLDTPDRPLWMTLQSFDEVFKINRLEVNKANIRSIFVEFSESQGFPIGNVESNQYLELWLAWVEYINSRASSISTSLAISNGTNHNYKNMYKQLVWLTNAKFVIQYLQNNNSFKDSAYADGANYVNAALLKVYQSLTELKTQIKNVIKYIKKEDKRFYPSSIK